MATNLLILFRLAAALLALPWILGFLWFFDMSKSWQTNFLMATTGIALVIVAASGDAILAKLIARIIVVSIVIIGSINCAENTIHHFNNSNTFGIIFGVITLSILVVFIIRTILMKVDPVSKA